MKYIYICLIFALSMPARTVLAQSSQTVCANNATTPVSFTFNVPNFPYTWVNDNPAIGLPASGTGHIGSFVAQNNTQTTQVANLTVTANYGPVQQLTFINPTPISISGNGTTAVTSPYPATVAVDVAFSHVTEIWVILYGFSHPSPQDVDILLVGPNGQQTIIMSDVGGTTPVSNQNIHITDIADNYINTTGPLIGLGQNQYSYYLPTNSNAPSDSPDLFPAPAPAVSSTVASMAVFHDIDTRGTWSLYVVDDQGNNVGNIANGWGLTIGSAWIDNSIPQKKRVFTYTVNPTPAVSLSHNAPQTCAVQLTATSGGSQYAFSTGAITQGSNTALVSQAGVYSVTLTDASGCSNTATTTVANGQVVAPTQLPAQAMSITTPGILGAGNCSVRITGQGQGNLFVVTGPGGYVYSNAYRAGGTYPFVAEEIKQPGTYTLTASYQNECGQLNSSSRTFVVTGTACR